MAKMGRPVIKIDWNEVDKLMALQCTGEEIAGFLGISYDTIEKAVKREHKMTYTEYYGLKAQIGRISLRRRQWKSSEKSVPMQMHLGNQWLGQLDRREVATDAKVEMAPIDGFTLLDQSDD